MEGSATELVSLIKVEIQPHVITRKLNILSGDCMQNMAFIIRTTVPMMEEKYGFGKTIRKQRDSW